MSEFLGYIKAETKTDFDNWLGCCSGYSETASPGTVNKYFDYPKEERKTVNYTVDRYEKDGEVVASVNNDLPDPLNPSINSFSGIATKIYEKSELEILGWALDPEI